MLSLCVAKMRRGSPCPLWSNRRAYSPIIAVAVFKIPDSVARTSEHWTPVFCWAAFRNAVRESVAGSSSGNCDDRLDQLRMVSGVLLTCGASLFHTWETLRHAAVLLS